MSPVATIDALRLGAATVRVLADGDTTGGAYALLEVTAPAGAHVPRRTHANEDLGILVLEGVVEVETDGGRRVAGPGTHLVVPRGVAQAATVRSRAARVLVVSTPAGPERLVRMLADQDAGPRPDADDVAALLAMAGVQALHPARAR